MTGACDFYVTGGTLPAGASSYVTRSADSELLGALQNGEFCYVLDTRQMGKSSLIVRTAGRLKESGFSVAVLDLTAVGRNLTPDQWYGGLLIRVEAQLCAGTELEEFWSANRSLGPMQRFFSAITSIVAADAARRVVLFVDEIDAVRSLPFPADEFFAGVREVYNRRALDPALGRINVCLAGVATPADLISDSRMSPFNIGRRIELRDFTQSEAGALAPGLTAGPDGATRVLAHAAVASQLLTRVLYWTNGHPYLTQLLCRAVGAQADQPMSRAADDHAAYGLVRRSMLRGGPRHHVDRVCERLFLSQSARATDDNLTFVRNRLLTGEVDLAGLLDMYRQVRARRRVRDDDTNPYCTALRLSGVVREAHGVLALRNRIYERVFDRDWVEQHMPDAELRRQRTAYRQGVLRATAGGTAMAGALAILATVAGYQAHVARTYAREAESARLVATERLSRSILAEAQTMQEDGDLLGALTPLSEAMRLDADDPARLVMDRYRLASLLDAAPQLVRMFFAGGPLTDAQVSPNGRRLATADVTGAVQVWDAATGRPCAPTMRQTGRINALAFSPDGRRLLTCGDNRVAIVWDVQAGRTMLTLRHAARVVGGTWSRDGRRVATAGPDTATVWDVTGPGPGARAVVKDVSPSAQITTVAFSPDGNTLVVGAPNYVTYTFDAATGGDEHSLPYCYNATHVEFSPDGRAVLASGALSGASVTGFGAFVYEAHGPRHIHIILRQDTPVLDARFSPDGSRIVTAGADNTARVWDAHSRTPISAPMRSRAAVISATFTADGRRVVTACSDGTARVWNAATGAPIGAPIHVSGAPIFATFDPRSDRLMTAAHDGTMCIWRLRAGSKNTRPAPGRLVAVLGADRLLLAGEPRRARGSAAITCRLYDAHDLRPVGAASVAGASPGYSASSSAHRLVLTSGEDAAVWDIASGRLLGRIAQARTIAMTPDGETVLATDGGGRLSAYDYRGRRRFGPVATSFFVDRAVAPDGARCVVGDRSGALHCLSTTTGRTDGPTIRLPGSPYDVHFTPDGRRLFVLMERAAEVFDMRTGLAIGAPFFAPPAAGYWQHQLTFSPDGKRAIVMQTADHGPAPVLLWDLTTCRPMHPAEDPAYSTEAVFSPDSRMYSTTGASPRVWDAVTGLPLTPPLFQGVVAIDILFSPDSTRLLTVGADSTARLWQPRTGAPLTAPMRHPSSVICGAFSPDCRFVVTGCADGTLRLWDARTGEQVGLAQQLPEPVRTAFFTSDGMSVIASGSTVTRRWPIAPDMRPVDAVRCLATVLSAQQQDVSAGSVPADTAAMRMCWQRLHPDGR